MTNLETTARTLFEQACSRIGTNERVAEQLTAVLQQERARALAHGDTPSGRAKVSRWAVGKWLRGEADIPVTILVAACQISGLRVTLSLAEHSFGAPESAAARALPMAVGDERRRLKQKLRVMVGPMLVAFLVYIVLATGSVDPRVWAQVAAAVVDHIAAPTATEKSASNVPQAVPTADVHAQAPDAPSPMAAQHPSPKPSAAPGDPAPTPSALPDAQAPEGPQSDPAAAPAATPAPVVTTAPVAAPAAPPVSAGVAVQPSSTPSPPPPASADVDPDPSDSAVGADLGVGGVGVSVDVGI